MFSVNKIYNTSERGTTVIRIAKSGTQKIGGLEVTINDLFYIELSSVEGLEEGAALPEFTLAPFKQTESQYTKDDGTFGTAIWLSPIA